MSKVKVCFSTIICYEDFSVLNGIHCSRININIRIKFLHCHSISAGLQKTTERCCCDSFSKTGYDTSGDKHPANA